jgi:hypothetical protein
VVGIVPAAWAYEEARRRVAAAARSGAKDLDLSDLQHLEQLPPQIGHLTELRHLRIFNTRVTDLAPLSELLGLESLNAGNTPVSDLTPLAGLTALRRLILEDTRVVDPMPIRGLVGLVEGARQRPCWGGLRIGGTPAVDGDPVLRVLARLHHPEGTERTLDYLRSKVGLPPIASALGGPVELEPQSDIAARPPTVGANLDADADAERQRPQDDAHARERGNFALRFPGRFGAMGRWIEGRVLGPFVEEAAKRAGKVVGLVGVVAAGAWIADAKGWLQAAFEHIPTMSALIRRLVDTASKLVGLAG